METEVPCSIPSQFSASVSETLTLDIRIFNLSVLPVQLSKSYFHSSSLLFLRVQFVQSKQMSFSVSVLYLPDPDGTENQYLIVALWSGGQARNFLSSAFYNLQGNGVARVRIPLLFLSSKIFFFYLVPVLRSDIDFWIR